MKNIVWFVLFAISNIFISTNSFGQPFKSLAIWPCDGIRSTNFNGIVEVSDGYVAMGHIDTFYNGQFGMGRIWVVKLNVDGTIKWSKFFRDSNPDVVVWGRRLALADNDGVYVLAQKASETGVIIKIDKNGKEVWRKKTIVMPNSSSAHDLITTSDYGCFAVGNTVSSDTGAYVKIMADGSFAFQGKIKPENVGKINFYGADIAPDGGYYLTGIQNEYNPYPNWRSHMINAKINSNGQIVWTKAYHGGDELSGDKIKSLGYSIKSVPGGGFIAGGISYKESILNAQALLVRSNDNGDLLWTKFVFEEDYPYNLYPVDNAITRIDRNDATPDLVFSEFVENEGTSTAKNYLITIAIDNGEINSRQTGYTIGNAIVRNFYSLMKNGQACFIGGENFLDYPRKGLILWTTADGYWKPPIVSGIDATNSLATLISKMNPHIDAKRWVQISTNPTFSNVVYEKTNIVEDTVILDLSSLDNDKYFLRVGLKGNLGPSIWSDTLEFVLYSNIPLRYVSQVNKFSSQYGGDWSVNELIGPPDVYPQYGDLAGAWASSTPDGSREFLELKFNDPDYISAVIIYETYFPGSIDTVYLKNDLTNNWVPVYTVTATPNPNPGQSNALTITFPPTSFKVGLIRLAINSPKVPGYNEIDAVGLIDAKYLGVQTSLNEKKVLLKITPNPGAYEVWIDWQKPSDLGSYISIFNISGKLVYSVYPEEGNTGFTVNTSSFSPGSYIINFTDGNYRKTALFVKSQ